MEIKVPKTLFEKMCNGVQCTNIGNGFVNKTFFFQNNEIVITGSMSSGRSSYSQIWGHYVIDIEKFREDIIPLSYNQHRNEVDKGKRERGYRYQKTRFGARTLVFVGERITVFPVDSGVQLELF